MATKLDRANKFEHFGFNHWIKWTLKISSQIVPECHQNVSDCVHVSDKVYIQVYNRACQWFLILNLIKPGIDVTKRSPPVLVPCHLGQNWSRADDLKFTTVNYYCKYDEIKKMDLAKNFEVKTYHFIVSVHCPLRVWAFEPSTIKLLCLQVVKSSIEKSKNRYDFHNDRNVDQKS